MSTAVCQRCLFSSSQEDDFLPEHYSSKSGSFSKELCLALNEQQSQRESILQAYHVHKSDLERQRGDYAGLVSYLLAIHSGLVKADHGLRFALFHLAHDYLRAAHLAEQALINEVEHSKQSLADELLTQSLYYFERVWEQEDYPNHTAESTIYLICVIHLCLGQFEQSREFFKLLDRYKRNPPVGMNEKKSQSYWLNMRKLYLDYQNESG